MRWFPAAALAFLAAFEPASLPATQDDTATIIRQSVQANLRDWNEAPHYDYFECDREENGDTKTYKTLMVFGTPYQQLVAENGKPLSPQLQAEEKRKLEAATAQRRQESQEERAKRIEAYETERKRDHLLMEQMTLAFDFKPMGEQEIRGRAAYVFKATPHAGYQPPNREAKALTGMEGMLWIDKKTFQWIRVEAHVVEPVSIVGFLARVEPGTRFELEKAPVADGVWLPTHFAMKAVARVFALFRHEEQDDETYSGYSRQKQKSATNERE